VLIVHPAEADTGVRFVYHGEMPIIGTIPARWDMVVDTHGGIVLGNSHGATLRGATPLLAALRVAGVDNAVVELYGPRIPAEVSDFDFYLDMLTDVGVQAQAEARRLLYVVDTVEARDSLGFATLSPASEFRACVKTRTTLPGVIRDMASAIFLSEYTEPYTGFRATLDGSHEDKLFQAGDAGSARMLVEIRELPTAQRASMIEMIGHLALAGAPVAGYVRAQGSAPGLYQALLHNVMQGHAVKLTTVDAHRARLHTATRSGVSPADCTLTVTVQTRPFFNHFPTLRTLVLA
jgi:UDP-3-O-[3-hydroxymyristoyl] N-acetylglucosamine deacetylase